MTALLRGNDARFVFPSLEQAEALSTEDIRSWVIPALKNDYLELSIVGDLEVEQTLPILARTIGALPKRSASKPGYDELRTLV